MQVHQHLLFPYLMCNIDRCSMCSGKEYLFYQNISKHTLAQVCQVISSLTDFCFLIVWNMDSSMFDLLLNKFPVIFKWLFSFSKWTSFSYTVLLMAILFCVWSVQLTFSVVGFFLKCFVILVGELFFRRGFICGNSGIPRLWKWFFKVFSFSICFFQIPL